MSHGHVGLDAVSGQEPGQRQVGGQHGRLRDRGLAQIVFGFGDGIGVGLVNEDEFAERLAEQRRHHAIGFGKSFGHNRLRRAERSQHVHVLRALAGIQERHLGRRTVTAEDALRAQSFPDRRLIGRQRLERLGRFVRQFGGIGSSRSPGVRARAGPIQPEQPAPVPGPPRRPSRTARKRSASAASEAAPITSAPRNGAL